MRRVTWWARCGSFDDFFRASLYVSPHFPQSAIVRYRWTRRPTNSN